MIFIKFLKYWQHKQAVSNFKEKRLIHYAYFLSANYLKVYIIKKRNIIIQHNTDYVVYVTL